MALPPINIRINGDTRDLEQSIERVQGELSDLRRVTQSIEGNLRSFGNSATDLGERMLPVSGAIGGVGAALTAIVVSTTSSAREISSLSRVANASTAEFQRMAAAARTVGVDQDQLGDILKDVNDRVGDFITTGGGPMADFFKNIAPQVGVTAEQFAGLSGPKALQLYVSSLEAAGVGQQAMTFYLEAMASDTTKLIPLLQNGGAEMRRLGDDAAATGKIIDESTIAASQEFGSSLQTLKDNMTAATNEVGAALIPVLIELMDRVTTNVIPGIVSMADGIAKAIEWFGQLPKPVQEFAAVLTAALGAGGPALMAVGIFSRVIAGLLGAGPIGLLIGAASLAVAAWSVWGEDIIRIVGTAVDWITEKFNGFVEFFTGLPERFMEFGRSIIDGLRMGIDEAWEAVKASITEKIDWLPAWVKERLGIASPSRVFAEIGQNIGQGMAAGINSSFGLVRAATADMSDAAVGGALEMASGVVGAMGQMFEGSKPIAIAQALIDTYQGVTKALAQGGFRGIARAAAVAAKGFAAVRSIQATRPGSGGPAAIGGGSAGGTTATAAQAPQVPTQTLRFDFGGQNSMGMEQLVNLINDAHDRGYRIRGVIA
jgi:uncharacterized membrane protein YphA (DoxX/SURF4 family)